MLAERYRNQGFDITPFGASSRALRRFNKVVYVFSDGVQEDQEFMDALCNCHLKMARKKYARPETLNCPSFSFAGLPA